VDFAIKEATKKPERSNARVERRDAKAGVFTIENPLAGERSGSFEKPKTFAANSTDPDLIEGHVQLAFRKTDWRLQRHLGRFLIRNFYITLAGTALLASGIYFGLQSILVSIAVPKAFTLLSLTTLGWVGLGLMTTAVG
jgi:hypothetical protein